MARPIKKGLEYFSLDVSFYNDIKIRKLIRRKGGDALSVYTILLCKIYEEGYYVSWDDDLPFIISEITDLEEDRISDIIVYCVTIGLFDQQLFEDSQVLTSHGIQKRYFAACALTKRKMNTALPYLLIESSPKAMDTEITSIHSEETIVFSEETGISSEETTENSEFSTQRKEKKRKENNSLRSSFSAPPPPTPPVRVCEDDSKTDESCSCTMTAADGVAVLKNDRSWLLQMQRKFGIQESVLRCWMDSFVVDCDCRGKQLHDSLADVKQHLNDWMMKCSKSKGGSKTGDSRSSPSSTLQERWNRCHAELCQQVSKEVSQNSFDLLSFLRYDEGTSELHVKIASKDAYEYIEHQQELVNIMQAVFGKYFGKVTLKYHLF